MKKSNYTPFAILFCLMLAVMPLLYFLLPWQTYSEAERRMLAESPQLTLDHWSDDTETFLADHLPLRNALTGLNALNRRVTGLDVMDDVWQLKNGALVERPVTRDDDRMLKNLGRMTEFAGNHDLPLYLMAVPSSGAVCGEEAYLPYPDAEILSLLAQQQDVTLIPLMDAFLQAEGPLYYRTDPHWNGEGVYLAYTRAAEILGFTPVQREQLTLTHSEGFYGTCYTRAALWGMVSDALDMWDSGVKVQVSLDGGEYTDSLYFREHLESGDQYPVFLDGNHGLTRIVNTEAENAPNLLILKDSFANSLLPLLVPHYHEITMVDLRAYRGSVAELAQEKEYAAILSIYSLDRLINDVNFAWLR